MELTIFPRAVEVDQIESEKNEDKKGWLKKWLDRASTVNSSVKDILDNLPSYAKYALTLFNELIDLFKEK
jgi:hypothetical protein